MRYLAKCGVIVAILLQTAGWLQAQTVPARLALFGDPAPGSGAAGLVLGTTTLDQARQLFPDAPTHPGPFNHASTNPFYMKHEPNVEIDGKTMKWRYTFWLGSGRAALFFDEHQRLVSIADGSSAYTDPASGKLIVGAPSWKDIPLTRNEFRAHYPGTKGEWLDPVHYGIEGIIGQCLALTAYFTQTAGQDKLVDLRYHFTCPTQPAQ
jgi:hypothetical protein